MAYEQKDMSGSLFKNDRKEKDTHPDRTGTALIDGREYWVSGWLKTGARGQFLSLAFKPKDFAQREPQTSLGNKGKPATYADTKGRADPISSGRAPDLVLTRPRGDMDDEIPF